VKLPGGYLITSADPITGVSNDIGRYAVKVSANDVATSGNRPQFAESVILLPEGSTTADLDRIALQVHRAAEESRISILGGHTEVTPGLKRPIVVVTVFGFVQSFVSAAGAKEGDAMLMTKTAGLEGSSELASEHSFREGEVPSSVLKRARGMIGRIDITEEAVRAFRTGRVHAMHDCTEGGVLGAAFEMSFASGLGFRLEEEAVPVAPETKVICNALSLDPLKLIGSGSLLIAAEKGAEDVVIKALRPVAKATKVGEFTRGRRSLVSRGGREILVREAPEDELWRVLSGPRRLHDGP
jgi:hydrogenase expression/formation protein HypE